METLTPARHRVLMSSSRSQIHVYTENVKSILKKFCAVDDLTNPADRHVLEITLYF